jgi:hypothetical protein
MKAMEELQKLLKEKIGMEIGTETIYFGRVPYVEVLGNKNKIYDFLSKMTEVKKSCITLPKEIYFLEDNGKTWMKVDDLGDMVWKVRQF